MNRLSQIRRYAGTFARFGFKNGSTRIVNLNNIDFIDFHDKKITFFKKDYAGIFSDNGYFVITYQDPAEAKASFSRVSKYLANRGDLVDMDSEITYLNCGTRCQLNTLDKKQ